MSANSQRSDLIAQYEQLTGAGAPSGLSISLLTAIIDYESQAALKGGLPVRIRRQLGAIAGDTPIAPAPASLRTGARLVRDWNGTSHVVDVEKGGFIYRERTYRSLSAIAREITGARWSGPRFFGLRPSE